MKNMKNYIDDYVSSFVTDFIFNGDLKDYSEHLILEYEHIYCKRNFNIWQAEDFIKYTLKYYGFGLSSMFCFLYKKHFIVDLGKRQMVDIFNEIINGFHLKIIKENTEYIIEECEDELRTVGG